MINFLVLIDKKGKIENLFWSNPSYIISKQYLYLTDIFSPEDQKFFLASVEKSHIKEYIVSCDAKLMLKEEKVKVGLCLLKVDDKIIVFAREESPRCDEFTLGIKGVIHSFMYTIKEFTNKQLFSNMETARMHFEKIQMLNNELINTRRMLEKANAQLTVLNNDLNNRLVKDALTGLVSRYQYRSEMECMIGEDPGKMGVFTFIDIDNFKSVNDNFGHPAGDKYLIAFGERLKSLPIPNTIKLRISGDEFGLFSYGWDNEEEIRIEDMWHKIKEYVLFGPINVDDQDLPLSISAGMAVYGKDTNELYELIEYADFAMYQAKKRGKNSFRTFNKDEYHLEKNKNEKNI